MAIEHGDGKFAEHRRVEVRGARTLLLASPEGMAQFGEVMHVSRGSALVVVHPFFPEGTYPNGSPRNPLVQQTPRYKEYLRNLRFGVQLAEQSDIPVVLFEERKVLGTKDDPISRLALQRTLFVVPTNEASSRPSDIAFHDLAAILQARGLKQVLLSGSYFFISDPSLRIPDFNPSEDMPLVARQYSLTGCGGKAVERFLHAGIDADLDDAIYPGFIDEKKAAAMQAPTEIFRRQQFFARFYGR